MARRRSCGVGVLLSLAVLVNASGVHAAETCTPDLAAPPLLSVAVGDAPSGLAAADLNADGILDLVVTDYGSDDVAILIGNGITGSGDGTFADPVYYTVGDGPQSVVVADWNADGILDLAVANDATGDVSVLLGGGSGGLGDGTFGSETRYAAGNRPVKVVTADFNEDGILDLAVSNQTSDSVSVLIGQGSEGKGDGTFASAVHYAVSGHCQPLIVADFDANGVLDLATTAWDTGVMTVLLGAGSEGVGDGTFTSAGSFPVSSWPGSLVAEDLSSDGILDVAAVDYQAGSISVALGGGSDGAWNGTFLTPASYPSGEGPSSVLLDDFDCDGILDLAVGHHTGGTVAILTGDGEAGAGDGTFAAPVVFEALSTPTAMLLADLNSDGRRDIVVANHDMDAISVLFDLNAVEWLERPVVTGTNLISVPVLPFIGTWEGWTWSDILWVSDPQAVFAWSAQTGAYVAAPAPEVGTPVPGAAYWVKAVADEISLLEGLPVSSPCSVELVGASEGGRWNLVGNPYCIAIPWSRTGISVRLPTGETHTLGEAADLGWVRDHAWLWDGVGYRLVCDAAVRTADGALSEVPPTGGLWVRAFRDCEIIFDVEP